MHSSIISRQGYCDEIYESILEGLLENSATADYPLAAGQTDKVIWICAAGSVLATQVLTSTNQMLIINYKTLSQGVPRFDPWVKCILQAYAMQPTTKDCSSEMAVQK